MLELEKLNLSNLFDKNQWFDHSDNMLRFQLSDDSIQFLRAEFGAESNKKVLKTNYKINYVVDCGNQFDLNSYFKYYVFDELKPKEYKACVMDTPKYSNLVIISKR